MTLRQVGFIELPGGRGAGFDHADTYLAPSESRVYVAHTATSAVDVIACVTNTYLRSIPDLPGVAGVLVDTAHDLLITSDRGAAQVSVFRCSDEQLLLRARVDPRPNGLAYDLSRRNVFAFNLGEPAGTNCTASVISLDERRVVRTLPLPGRPRWAVFDAARERVYVNIQAPAVILVIDTATLRETERIDVGCEGPHGLALVEDRLFCAADGRELVVIDVAKAARSVVARLPLRGAPDVVMHAPTHRRLFVAIGSPGLVSSFDTEKLIEVETIETAPGAHTIAWDPSSAQLYVFSPQRGGALVYREGT